MPKKKKQARTEAPPVRRPTPKTLGVLAQWTGWRMEEHEVLMEMIVLYVKHVIVPRILADRRRRRGDPAISPRDYACFCPVSRADGLPNCLEHRASCRFRRRRPPGPKYANDPVRHQLFQQEFRALTARLPEMSREDRSRFADRLADWFEAYLRRRKRRVSRGSNGD